KGPRLPLPDGRDLARSDHRQGNTRAAPGARGGRPGGDLLGGPLGARDDGHDRCLLAGARSPRSLGVCPSNHGERGARAGEREREAQRRPTRCGARDARRELVAAGGRSEQPFGSAATAALPRIVRRSRHAYSDSLLERREPMAGETDHLARGLEVAAKLWGARGGGRELPAQKLAPEFFGLVAQFVFGMFWSRPNLDLRSRSLSTVAQL